MLFDLFDRLLSRAHIQHNRALYSTIFFSYVTITNSGTIFLHFLVSPVHVQESCIENPQITRKSSWLKLAEFIIIIIIIIIYYYFSVIN